MVDRTAVTTDRLRHIRFEPAASCRDRPRAVPCPRRPHEVTIERRVRACEPLAAVDPFIAWLLGRVGLNATPYRAKPLERRLSACLRALKVHSTDAARQRIEDRPDLLPVAVGALLLGVTEFFRDKATFRTFAELLADMAARRSTLRIWSAACSDGPELYSVAMLLADRGLLHGCELLGTDCREDAIAHARRGVYERKQIDGIETGMRERFFRISDEADDRASIHPDLRARTRWQVHDLLTDTPPPGPWDVILWRNHAIYLRQAASARLWESLVGALRPGGLLVAGRAERPDRSMPLDRLDGCVYRKR